MNQFTQGLYLGQLETVVPIFKFFLQHLRRHCLPCGSIRTFKNLAEGSATQTFQFLIFFHIKMTESLNILDYYNKINRLTAENRKQLEEFATAVVQRIKLQEIYSKGLYKIAGLVNRPDRKAGMASVIFSAFISDHHHRAEQSKILSQSLRDQVQIMIRTFLNDQANQLKKLNDQFRGLENDLQSKKNLLEKNKNRFSQNQKQYKRVALINEPLWLTSDINIQKRQKTQQKVNSVSKQLKQQASLLQKSISDYNSCLQNYPKQFQSVTSGLQKIEINRLNLMQDIVMKFLVFQTSMLKNLQYDIDQISKQLQILDANKQVETLKVQLTKENSPIKSRHSIQTFSKNYVTFSLLSIDTQELSKLLQQQNNKDLRQFITALFAKQVESNDKKLQLLADILQSSLKNSLDQTHLSTLKNLHREVSPAVIYSFVKIRAQQINRQQLTQTEMAGLTLLIKNLIEFSSVQSQTYLIRKLLNFSTIYFRNIETGQNKLRYQMINQLLNLDCWKSHHFWQALIIESFFEERKNFAKSLIAQTVSQTVQREGNLKLNLLVTVCNYMLMLLIPTKEVRKLVGDYCKLYSLPDERIQSLSKTITQIFKQVKTLIDAQLIPKYGLNKLGIQIPD